MFPKIMYKKIILVLFCVCVIFLEECYCEEYALEAPWAWNSIQNRIPMNSEYEARKKKFKISKKFRKFILPLLLAYKLKFFTLVPVMIGGLILLSGATGLAGFFFALFAAVMGLKGGGHY